MSSIRLVIGLGNPGVTYRNTYHNAGIQFAEYAASLENKKLLGERTVLSSTVYMNESGTFVARAMRKLGVKPEELLIAHDDSDLALGSTKISFGRGAAGHHGVESVIASLKTTAFTRLRIGIRPSNEKLRTKAGDFVLRKINPAAKHLLVESFRKALLTIRGTSDGTSA